VATQWEVFFMRKLLFSLMLLVSTVSHADVILCTGMSNARDVCRDWIRNNATGHHIVNGAVGGFDIVRLYENSGLYWGLVLDKIAQQGLSPADIDVIWNKNATRARSGDLITERQLVHDYFIWFQGAAESLFPNLKAGYHSPRTSGEFCSLNPEPFAGDVTNAILGIGDSSGAVTHFDKWHFGPDLSAPDYTTADFTDGCHPSSRGLAKTTPIMNAFFDDQSEPPPPPQAAPVITNDGAGLFTVRWQGVAALLSCGNASFTASGQTHVLSLPTDLPFRIKHRCTLDGGEPSREFGCLRLSQCSTF
jgi:hypothetical protein